MQNSQLFPFVLHIALVVLNISIVVGVMGLAASGSKTDSIILRNFGWSLVAATFKKYLIVGILFTYPL